jgi:site-specific recombinase
MVLESSRAAANVGFNVPPELVPVLEALDPNADLAARLDALEDLARQVIELPAIKRLNAPAPLQLARLQTLLHCLAAVPSYRQRLAATLSSVLRDTTAVALFAEAGMPSDRGISNETLDRIARRILPRPPNDENLERFVSRVFRRTRDCAWIEAAPTEIFVELGNLLGDIWKPLREAMSDAVALLATRISALGLSIDLRERSDPMHVRDSPFFRIPHVPLEQIPMLILECRGQLASIRKRLETTGVSVDVVYCIDTIRRMLLRMERMLPFLMGTASPVDLAAASRGMLAALTAGRIADDSLRQLARQNLGLLARKVIERVGHTGEHYVTSTRREYFKMLASAAGGGALTAITVVNKFIAKSAHLAPFIDGVIAAGNYAGSFLIMQFLGFTLATKQPSMTAAALAATIKETKGQHQLDELVILIARISRSQFAAAVGNVFTVIPVAIVIDLLWLLSTGHHFLEEKYSTSSIASFHPLESGTIFFAALTGVLLWLSSLGAGWLENWVTYRQLPDAIRAHPLGKVFGRERMNRIADFVTHHCAGIGGCITLGVLLGMTPIFGAFFGLPLDVRHITLSTGTLAFAACTLGIEAITVGSIVGIAVIGLLNFGVSFLLALMVALRAREVTSEERAHLAMAVFRRFLRNPLQFFYPPKPGRANTAPPVAPP